MEMETLEEKEADLEDGRETEAVTAAAMAISVTVFDECLVMN